MPKKLKLVLREPVKLYDSKAVVKELPEIDVKSEEVAAIAENNELEMPAEPVKKINPAETNEPAKRKGASQIENPKAKSQREKPDLEKILTTMSPRVRQIWDYFCAAARADGDLKNSFTVTRSEVMKKAGIGSTNTYRDALKKFQHDGLIEIELRPGVISGSVFYLTEKGRELAEYK